MPESDEPNFHWAEGIDLEVPELDLRSIDSLEDTALWHILQDLYGTSRDIGAANSAPGDLRGSHGRFTAHSSHSTFSAFASYIA
jgi:hypothetical protein